MRAMLLRGGVAGIAALALSGCFGPEPEAKLAQAQAARRLADIELLRQRGLKGTSAELKAKLDSATAAADSAVAAEAAAQAALAHARWALGERTAAAPAAARVEDVFFHPGEVVAAGQPVVRLLPPGNVVVRAYLGAAMLARLPAGTQAALRCDACGEGAKAAVSFVSSEAAYAPPVLYSREGAAKLAFLVELTPDGATAARLRPGQPVRILPPGAAK
ncbi:MAG: HlyD family efflux transporter periplasmic adaptor subunit [Rhodospirillaceae bacterium]